MRHFPFGSWYSYSLVDMVVNVEREGHSRTLCAGTFFWCNASGNRFRLLVLGAMYGDANATLLRGWLGFMCFSRLVHRLLLFGPAFDDRSRLA